MKWLIILSLIFNIIMVIPISATTINILTDYANIQEGIDASSHGDTILVQPGTYVENLFLDEQTVVLASLYLTTGDESYIEHTIIDGNASGPVVTFHYQNDYAEGISSLIGFTIRNGYGQYGGGIDCRASDPVIDHNVITGNTASRHGGGILCWTASNSTISNNKIFNNSADEEGGGLWICWSHPTVTNNLIYSNQATTGGGVVLTECQSPQELIFTNNLIARNETEYLGSGICCVRGSVITIANSTIVDNASGFGISVDREGSLTLLNTIVWGNGIPPIDLDTGSSISISYSDVEDGWAGIGNIEDDPLFCYPDTLNYFLQEDSPCVGAGQDGANIGAFGIGCPTVSIFEELANLPTECALKQNYPNPFNTSTQISYELPLQSEVTIDIYDILGRTIRTLYDDIQPAGYHNVQWRALDFSSGMYFYKLQAGDYSETMKMLFIK